MPFIVITNIGFNNISKKKFDNESYLEALEYFTDQVNIEFIRYFEEESELFYSGSNSESLFSALDIIYSIFKNNNIDVDLNFIENGDRPLPDFWFNNDDNIVMKYVDS